MKKSKVKKEFHVVVLFNERCDAQVYFAQRFNLYKPPTMDETEWI